MRITHYEYKGRPNKDYPEEYNVAFFCENCGIEQASLFEGKGSRLHYNYFRDADTRCPICSKLFQKKPGYYSPLPGESEYSSLDKKFAHITEIREKTEMLQMQNAVDALAQTYDLPTVLCNPNANYAAIKSHPEKLREYVKCIISLENSIYSLKQRLVSLYFERMQNDRYAVRCAGEKTIPAKDLIQRRQKQVDSSIEKLEAIRNEGIKIHFLTVPYPKKPQKPTPLVPGLFNRKKVLAENEALTAQYNAAMEEYRIQVANCDAEKERLIQEAWENQHAKVAQAENIVEAAKQALAKAEAAAIQQIEEAKTLPSLATAIKEVLDTEILEAEELLSKLFAARNELYAYDIIYGKYRDVVALSSFYEYLMSGRCTTLEGADGAYNIYESEIRANRVISQLDTVISALEDIKQNQYMMYQELRSINATLTVLNSTMDKALTSIRGIEANTASMSEYMEHISRNSDVIAHNTAATAYYSKVNAELTNALGYMVAFK